MPEELPHGDAECDTVSLGEWLPVPLGRPLRVSPEREVERVEEEEWDARTEDDTLTVADLEG